MKRTKFLFPLALSLMFLVGGCSSDDDELTPDPDNIGTVDPPAEAQPINLKNHSKDSGVMMQAFYWDVEPRHGWWDLISEKVGSWADAGIDRIWLPPASKGQSGGYSMGYDPSDYYDLGEYDQHLTVETRFGSRTELENLIEMAHSHGLEVIADVVLNHNSGGGEEWNPYREKMTFTLFNKEHGNASGMFDRNYENFYPNSTSPYDEGSLFYEETNLDHNQEYVQNWLWKADYSVAKFYKNEIGFDGWRFDYVKGFEPWVVKAWLDEVGGFSVAELWDGYAPNLREYIEKTGSRVFDFATFYKLEEALDRYDDLNNLVSDNMVWKTHPDHAVTFTANHDTEKDSNEDNFIASENKMKAYAFILTHPGYPTIFYTDYEESGFKEELNQLILINNTIATGDMEVLYVDEDEYVMRRSGSGDNPGLILYISTNNNIKRRQVDTGWNSRATMDYTYNTEYTTTTGEDGKATLEAPANGYAVYSIMKEE